MPVPITDGCIKALGFLSVLALPASAWHSNPPDAQSSNVADDGAVKYETCKAQGLGQTSSLRRWSSSISS